MGDDKILTKVAVGDVVTNELEFRRRFDSLVENPEDNLNYSGTRSLEEVLSQIDEDISEGRKFFPLKDIHQEVIRKDRQYGYEREMNRTRLKDAVLQRFPVLKEETGFRNKILLVTKDSMKDVMSSCIAINTENIYSSILTKAALICRKEMKRFWNEENHAFHVEQQGYKERCQQDSVPLALKFMIGKNTEFHHSLMYSEESHSLSFIHVDSIGITAYGL